MVEVFDDRVEISNPGGLPPSLKPEEFGNKSVPRNQVLAEMMMRVGYIEKMGTGIKKMRDLCKEAGSPEPEFTFGGFFTVTFKKVITPKTTHEDIVPYDTVNGTKSDTVNFEILGKKTKTEGKLLNRLAIILADIQNNLFENLDIQKDKMEISRRTLTRDIEILTVNGLIEYKGSAKTGKYVLTKEGERVIKR